MKNNLNIDATTTNEAKQLDHEIKELREMLKILNKKGPITRGEAAKVRGNKSINQNKESIDLDRVPITESIYKTFLLLEEKHTELIEQQATQNKIRQDLRVTYNEMSNIHQQLRECKAKINSHKEEDDEMPKKRGRYVNDQNIEKMELS